MAGALAPSAAGATIVRLAPPVMVKALAPVAGMVQASAKLAVATPVLSTFTGTVALPTVLIAPAPG